MFLRLGLGAGLIAATVVIQALFMSVGLNNFKRIEERGPGAMARRPATTTVIWILFLLIPIVLDVGRRSITSAAHYRALRKHSIFRLSPSQLSAMGSFSTVSGANWRPLKLSMGGSSSSPVFQSLIWTLYCGAWSSSLRQPMSCLRTYVLNYSGSYSWFPPELVR